MSKHKQTSSNKKLHLAQLCAGLISGYAVSPLNVVIDKSIVLYANGRMNLFESAVHQLKSLFLTPRVFLTSFEFRWMYFVYSFTYSANNIMDNVNLTDSVSHPIQKLLVCFLANTCTSLIKDKKYIQHFGARTEVKSYPISSLGLLFVRDMIAMAAAFTLPSIFGKYIQQKTTLAEKDSLRIAQLTCPLIVQIGATPIHLMGLDLYNRPDLSLANRMSYIRSIYLNTLFMRMMRFLPAYGIGGILNMQLRNWIKRDIE